MRPLRKAGIPEGEVLRENNICTYVVLSGLYTSRRHRGLVIVTKSELMCRDGRVG